MITVNGKVHDIESSNLLDFIIENGFDKERIAVELNGNIIKRGTYGNYIINNGDKVEIVCFVGGG